MSAVAVKTPPRYGGVFDPHLEPALTDAPVPSAPLAVVAMSVRPDGIFVAVEYHSPPSAPLWLGVGTQPPAVLPVGSRGAGGTILPLPCVQKLEEHCCGIQLAPILDCEAHAEAHASFVREHRDRFVRRFLLSPSGIESVDTDGSRTPVAGAEIATSKDGRSVEVRLPTSGMPRLRDAPVRFLRGAADTNEVPADVSLAPWRWIEMESPIDYEPHGELRSKLLALVQSDGSALPLTLSYHPDDPHHVESQHHVRPSGDPRTDPRRRHRLAVHARQDRLFTPIAKLGPDGVEVGLATASGRALAVRKAGRLVALEGLRVHGFGPRLEEAGDRIFKGAVVRNGEIHVFTFVGLDASQFTGVAVRPHWAIHRVDRHGTIHPPEPCLPRDPDTLRSEIVVKHDKSFGVLSWSEEPEVGATEPRPRREVTCRWNPAKKVYDVAVR